MLQAFGILKEQDVPDEVMYNATMTACRHATEWQNVLNLFAELNANLEVTHSTALTAVLASCGQASEWEIALQSLFQWKGQADVTSFTAAIHACEQGRRWVAALDIFVKSPAVDVPCFGAALSACAAAGRWMEALQIFDAMRAAGLQADAACRTALVDAVSRSSWARGLVLLNALRAGDGDVGDLLLCGAVLAGCQEAAQWHQALSLFEAMAKTSLTASGSLLLSLQKAGKWRHALTVVSRLPSLPTAVNLLGLRTAEQCSQRTAALRMLHGSGWPRLGEFKPVELVLYSSVVTARLLERKLHRTIFSPLLTSLGLSVSAHAGLSLVRPVHFTVLQAAAGLGAERIRVAAEGLQVAPPKRLVSKCQAAGEMRALHSMRPAVRLAGTGERHSQGSIS